MDSRAPCAPSILPSEVKSGCVAQDMEAAGSRIGVNTGDTAAADNPASKDLDHILDQSSPKVLPSLPVLCY